MTAIDPPVRYHAAKLRFLDESADADATYLRDVNRAFADLMELDTRLEQNYCRGGPFDPTVDAAIDTLFRAWQALAVRALAGAADGPEAEALRANVEEMAAMLAPTDGVAGELVDAAVADAAAGRTHGAFP
jgi:hypothetical protein